jgi:integrase
LRIITVDRRELASAGLAWANDHGVPADGVAGLFDRHGVPDGMAFVTDDDGGMRGCRFLNAYLIAALRQDAYALGNLKNNHLYHLVRFLRFVRRRRAEAVSGLTGDRLDEWLAAHGEPLADLTDATRQDLLDYKRSRQSLVKATSWQAESGPISVFFDYARSAGWITADPVPRWGGRRRNTFRGRALVTRQIRFLTEPQLRLFLRAGLRGEAPAPAEWAPAFPERDHVFGLTLAATALRRQEGAFLLDCEIPVPEAIAAGGVAEFVRYGKGQRPRTICVAVELAREIDLYRRSERSEIICSAQRVLRRRKRDGMLLIADGLVTGPDGRPWVQMGGRRIRPELLSNDDRARLARILPDGMIEPLGLFVSRRGLPPDVKHWNTIFADARQRAAASGHPDLPPAHLEVSPHVMRHTFAVRMLSGLMRIGRERASNPYLLLANPVLTIQQLLGHGSPEVTQRYLYAAELYNDELPAALREHVAGVIGRDRHAGPAAR